MTAFVIGAGVMTLIALAFIVMPLLRSKRHVDPQSARTRALDQALAGGVISAEEYASKKAGSDTSATTPAVQRSRSGYVALLLAVLLFPALAIVAYSQVGTPQALDPAVRQTVSADANAEGIDMDKAVAGLAAKLEENPGDGKGWALLGRAYQSMQRPEQAMTAFKRARELLPDDPDLMADYAQVLVIAGGKDFSGEPRQLLDRALSIQPDNQRALWLRGVAESQAGDPAASIATWTRLLELLPPGSTVAASVQGQIDEARANAGMPRANPIAPSIPESSGPIVPNAATLTVAVSVDPSIAAQVEPSMTVFVFARAVSGPPMPLSIQRLIAGQLPITITLDDSKGMLPNMKLSDFPQVIVGARISRSGDPIATSGDWQKLSEPVDVQQKDTIVLTIDQIVP